MKKNVWSKMLSLALALVCVIGLVACGGNGGSSAAAGTYRLQTITAAGVSMNLDELATAAGVSADDFKVTLDLKSDGSFMLDMSAMADTVGTGAEDTTMEGTWKESGSNIELESEGTTTTATLQDGVITLEEEGMSMTFKK